MTISGLPEQMQAQSKDELGLVMNEIQESGQLRKISE